MKYFWLSLFGFLAFVFLMLGIFQPDMLLNGLGVLGHVVITLAYMLVVAAAAVLFIGGGLVAWWWYRRTTVESLRQRDGHYPIQRVRVRGGRVVFIDPNQLIGPAIMVDRNTGETWEHEPAAGWHIQATIRGMVEQTRRAQAMYQGDASRSSQYGSQHRGDRITAAAAKLTAGGYDKKSGADGLQHSPPVDSTATPLLEAPSALTVRDGFNSNSNTKLALGQTSDGQLVMWDMTQTPHLRFHGQTQGSGKTNALQTVAAGAARLGAHVIVLDRRRFKDWQEFNGIAELIDSTDSRRFAAAVRALQAVYQERDRLLGQHGAPNIGHLPDAPRRVVAVISEFGALCDVAASEGLLADVLDPLKLILREAGATGVHVLLEDQFVSDKWPKGIAVNAEPVCGYLPQNYGAAGGYHYAHQLQPYQFYFAGAVFKTWHMKPVLRDVLAAAPNLGQPIVSSSPAVHGAVHGAQNGQFMGRSPEVDPPPVILMNSGMNTAPTTVDGWFEWTLDNYLPAHPELLQLDARGRGMGVKALADAMAAANGKDAEAMKGTASEVAKRLRAEMRLPSGERLGTDTTGGA